MALLSLSSVEHGASRTPTTAAGLGGEMSYSLYASLAIGCRFLDTQWELYPTSGSLISITYPPQKNPTWL